MIQIGLTQLSSSSASTAPCMASDKGNCWTPLTVAALHTLPGAALKKHTPLPGGLSPALAWLTTHLLPREMMKSTDQARHPESHTNTHPHTYIYISLLLPVATQCQTGQCPPLNTQQVKGVLSTGCVAAQWV